MDPHEEKVRKWLTEGKDPRSAHWQAGLESVMAVFRPYLVPGKIVPIQPIDEAELPVFERALETVDLSPGLRAVFLPDAVAEKITPPASAEELRRAPKEGPSIKLLVLREKEEVRILCAELSAAAGKPGVDIFQSGALLGTYDFEDQETTFSNLTRIIRAHLWEKGKWSVEEHRRYTVNWFERVMDLGNADIAVDTERSFFHSPSLVKSNRIDVLFLLIQETFRRRLEDAEDSLHAWMASAAASAGPDERARRTEDLARGSIEQFIDTMIHYDLIDPDSFTAREAEQFKREFDRTLRRISKKLQ